MKKNTLLSLLSSAVPMLLGLITIPYLIKHIGVEAFGVLSIIWVLIGYFSIFDFGIGRALTQQISSYSDSNNENLFTIIKTGLIFMVLTGLLGFILLLSSSDLFAYSWLGVSSILQNDTFNCLLIASIGIPITTITSGLKGILEGFEDFFSSSILKVLLGISNFALPALVVMFYDNTLSSLVFSLVFSRFLLLFLHVYFINKLISFRLILKASLGNKDTFRKLTSFGAWMTFSNVISPIMVNSDRFLISYILGASVVAYYTVPFDFILRLLIIPAALTTVLFPRLSTLYQKNIEEFKNIYKKSLQIIFAVMGLICLCLIFGSQFGLTLWLGEDFASKSWVITSILSIGLVFNSVSQVPYTAIQSIGKVKLTSLLHFFELIIYIPLLLFSIHYFGLIGAAIAWVLRVAIDFSLLSYFSRKIIFKGSL